MKKYFISLFVFLSIVFAIPVYAEVSAGSGFIPGQIWYSEESLIEGNTVNIHTAVWNGEKSSLSAKVEFYDKNVILGSRDIVLSALELKDVYIPWKITAGDHSISAKIISSKAIISGKEEAVSLRHSSTSSNKQSVAVVIKNEKGEKVDTTEPLNNFIEKAGTGISEIVPDNVSTSVSSGFTVVDNFREETSVKVDSTKDKTKEEINQIKADEAKGFLSGEEKNKNEDVVKKPITYIKLFLFTALSFIFGNKIVFYGLLILIVFYILRLGYRTIRNR